MRVITTFKNLESTDALKDILEKKADKITKFIKNPTKVTFLLSLERAFHIVELTVLANRTKYFGKGKSKDMYSSVDQAVEKIETQLRKHKEKMTHHKNYEKSADGKLRNAKSIFDIEHLSKEKKSRKKVVKLSSVSTN